MSRNKTVNIPENFTEPIISKDKFFLPALLLVFEIFLVFISNSKLAGEDDLFWYLSTGRYIVQTGMVPSADVFGFSTSGVPWIPFEWAWDIVNYYLFSFGGYFALSILSTLLILLIFFLLFQNLKKFQTDLLIIFVFLVILALGICLRFTVKPHLVSYLSLVLLLTIIIRYRYLDRSKYQILYFIPLIFLIWINLHMGVLNGLLLLGLYFCSELWGTISSKFIPAGNIRPLSVKELLRLAAVILLAASATLVNPHGLKTYEYAFHIVSMKQLDIIYEWQSPFNSAYLFTFTNYVYYFFILCLIPVIYYSFKKKDFLPGLLCLGFFLNSLNAARLTVDFMLVSVIFIAVSINFFFKKSDSKNASGYLRAHTVPKVVLLVIMFALTVLIPGGRLYKILGYTRTFGTGIDNNNFPVKMYSFINESKIESIGERPFNTYETGGFFIWNFPERKNFIGSRGLNDEVWNDYTKIINLQSGFNEKIDSLRFDYFMWMVPMLNYAQYPALLDHGILSYLFNESGKWKLVYWDDVSFLFVKNEPEFEAVISKYGYKYFNPYNFYFRTEKIETAVIEDKETLKKEIKRKQKEDSAGAFTGIMLKYYLNKVR